MCEVDGRKVVVTAGDFTVRGGSGGGTHGGLGEELSASERALEWRLPYVRLLDAAGGSVRSFEDLGRTYLPDGNSFTYPEIELMNVVPCVSAVMGAAAGIGALHTNLAHWNVMVAGTQVFPGGPPVVKAALGIDITKEELGGPQVHTQVSGVVDNLAAHRARGDRDDPRLPVVPADERRRAGAEARAVRPGRPRPGRAARARPEGSATDPRRPPADRAGRRRGLVLRDRAALRPGPDHRVGAHRGPSRGDHGQRPAPPRRGDRRRRRARRRPG